jgi:aspartate aminotransferase
VPGFAPRMDKIVGSATVAISGKVAEMKAAGHDMIGFSVGEPDFDTPDHVKQAAKDALDAGHTKYTPGPGIPALREAIAAYHQNANNIPCNASNVIATPTKQAVAMTFLALAGRGDEIILPDPAWVSYEPITRWAEATPVPVPCSIDDGFRMKADAVAEAITNNSKMILLNSPSNPTGAVNDPDEIRGIVELAVDHDLWIVSDEIYQQLIYDGKHLSPASLPDAFERTVTIDGLSKSHAMTGWRTGWLVAPEPAFKQINKLQSHSVTMVTSFAQYGAVAALNGPQDFVGDMREAFRSRRKVMVDGLNELPGVECPMPDGAFYAFPKFTTTNDTALCMKMIEEAHVAPTPGSAFGEGGKGCLRFSYATSEDKIREGLDRVAKIL